MKRVLITGANSYVGTNVEKWLMKEPDKYYVETLDMQDPNWKEFDFSSFDVVFHVAGIAHVSTKKSMKDLYFKVNRDLAIETAQKAKDSGVNQFIFMSSMIIYGKDNKINNFTNINVDKYNPINAYGQSKLDADLNIQKFHSNKFKVTILRCPVIYGVNSKGNFKRLYNISKKVPIIPKLINQRSMLYIDNFNIYIEEIIRDNKAGVFYPQNNEFVSTIEIMKYSRISAHKRVRITRLLNPLLIVLSLFIPFINKVFGNKTYELKENNPSFFSFKESLDIIGENK
jgi:nucleoside-diphosphate-sugar epimerase